LAYVAGRYSLREDIDREFTMKRIAAAIFALALSCGVAAADTFRVGSQVVSTDDSEGRLRQVVGKPDRETPIESPRGGLQGYRLEYYNLQKGKSVQFEVVNGRVRSITQIDS
jgi:hypothetical protein